MRTSRLGFFLLLSVAPAAVSAQTTPVVPRAQDRSSTPPAADDTDAGDSDIVVRGARPVGSVAGDIPPEQQLSPADIRSYGVSSVADLLAELAPQTRSGRGSGGAPVVLVNGKRVAGFGEIRDLPTEAILRVDILPEEVALKYGFAADQRVINFVLRPRFRAVTTELNSRFTTEGGIASPQGEFDLLRINRTGRITVHADVQGRESITEADRNITLAPNLFALGGNIVGRNGGEIDPLLSARAGSLVTVAGVPASAATQSLTLNDFAATANRANVTDLTPFRTLSPSSTNFNLSAVYATTIFSDISASLNGQIGTSNSNRLLGLPSVALTLPTGNRFSPFSQDVLINRALIDGVSPLSQRNKVFSGYLGLTLNGTLGKWQWTFTGTYDRNDSETITDTGLDITSYQARLRANDPTANPFGPALANDFGPLPGIQSISNRNRGAATALFSGSLWKLPAGAISTSVRVGGVFTDFSSTAIRAGIVRPGQSTRNVANGQVNIDVPITSRKTGFLGFAGNLSANFNIAYDYLSDFNTLRTLGYGLNWSPIEPVRVIASVTEQDEAPTQEALGNPAITTPNVVVFDYVRGENALVSVVTGGNRGLISENRLVKKLGLTIKPFDKQELTFTANYVDSRSNNPVAGFPSVTAAINNAFPDRFTRDADGRLLAIDQRSINFAQTSRSEIRLGVNFSTVLKSKIQKQIEAFRAGTGPNPFAGLTPPGGRRPPGAGQGDGPGGARPGGAPGGGFAGGGFGGGGFGGGGGRGGPGGGRLQFALYDTIHLTNRVQIGATGPTLDLLRGDTIGDRGGQVRHELEAQAGYNNNGIGARLSVNWRSGTTVVSGTNLNPDTLRFSSLGTANLRLFADLGQRLDLLKKYPWMRGMRVVLSVDNLFNERQRVTDQNGLVPISYQPGYLDPVGRSIRLSVRKLFF
ncbi:MAG: TonB-dependent receptor [Sphingomonas sp.]|nr:TonB-dependent receptor [Sphingomonas sp.]